MTYWKTWPKCIFKGSFVFVFVLFCFVLFCFVFVFVVVVFFLSSRRAKFELITALFSMKYGTWILDEQNTRQNTELKKSVVQSVLFCLSYLFMYILTSKFIKKWKKKKTKQAIKKKKLKAWILLNQSPKNKCAWIYFCSLIVWLL